MDIQTNHRVTLLNAKCNYVCAVDTLVKKMSYGEDVDCCINKLFLASRLINRLDCFCFETPIVETEVLAVFELDAAKTSYDSGTIVQLAINDVQIYNYTTVGTEVKSDVARNILNSLKYTFTETDMSTYIKFLIDFDCNVTEASYVITKVDVTTQTNLTNITSGLCATSNPPCYNCIEVSDLPKMYEVLHKLLQ